MLRTAFNYTLGIFLSSILPLIVIFSVTRFIQWISCFKVKECSKRKCCFNICCHKYKEICTEEELDKLSYLIEKYREKLENKE